MTLQEFKTLGGLFVVMLSFGLLYSFNMVEPDFAGNIHSKENVAMTDNIAEESTEHQTNGTVSASSITESNETTEDSNIADEEKMGLVSSGILIKQLNYDVSSRN